jgi:N-acetylglucosaminyldiphosphoundecaprenol N-acetyl-beta-D-mannosaminyltransferase
MSEILGLRFDLVAVDDVLAAICEWRVHCRSDYAVLANPHSVLSARRDPEFHNAITQARLTLPDGVGISIAARILGYGRAHRVGGPTIMRELVDRGRAHGFRHFFYGGGPGVADRVAEQFAITYPGLEVAGVYCPPFRSLTADEDQQAVEFINSTRPDLVWVGLGTGKQEKWMASHVGRIQATALLGVGAAFDFHSGNVPWAPEWIRRSGLEWAYRLIHEPRRLWRRNLDSPIFLAAVIAQRIGMVFGRIAERPLP